MSDKINNKQEGAMRLFNALSAVDEKYLAACEDDAVTRPKGVAVFMRRYGKGMAAVLCLAVLGAGYLSVTQNMGMDKTAATMENAKVAVNATPMADMACAEDAMSDDIPDDMPETACGMAEAINQQSAVRTEEAEKEACYDYSDAMSEKRDMTLAETEALAVVGNYIPSDWPEGGSFATIKGSDAPGAESAMLFWTYENDWDAIVVNVENLGSEIPQWVQDGIIDVARPETYDETLYEIPYAETVPVEYHLMFQEAIFLAEDFDKDCVRARIKAPSGDSGDTDTPRGRFGVLYKEDSGYVLVRFNGRGTVDDIWNLMK